MCGCWLLPKSHLWKSVSTHLGSRAVTQTQVCESFEVESTTNNKHDIQSRYVAKTMAYTCELFLMSCTYLLQDVHPKGDNSLSKMFHIDVPDLQTHSSFVLFSFKVTKQCTVRFLHRWMKCCVIFCLVCFNVNKQCLISHWKIYFLGAPATAEEVPLRMVMLTDSFHQVL